MVLKGGVKMRKFILGTDWGTDCDDAAAVRLITNAVKRKEIELLGIVINTCVEHSYASLKGFLTQDGLGEVPIGINLDAAECVGPFRYQENLAKAYCPSAVNADAENSVRLYRRLLAQTDGKVEMMEIGFLQEFAALLESAADDISDKTGVELVREKVCKVWVMAGKWDADGEKEYNFCCNESSREGGKKFCELCPVPVTFLGFEIGYGVITGDKLDKSDHLYKVFDDYGAGEGRHSWDPMLVMMALIGDEGTAGYDVVCGKATLDAETGENFFERYESGPHKFVVKRFDNSYYENQINNAIEK